MNKREEAVANFYEQCFTDFERKTHSTIISLNKENQHLKEEKQELVDYLKEQINICDDRIKSHTKEINGVVNISDNNRHIILIKRVKLEKQVYEEILSKIEKE